MAQVDPLGQGASVALTSAHAQALAVSAPQLVASVWASQGLVPWHKPVGQVEPAGQSMVIASQAQPFAASASQLVASTCALHASVAM